MNQNEPLWAPTPERVEASTIHKFIAFVEERGAPKLADYDALHAWSVAESGAFWDAVWDFCVVIGEKGERLVENVEAIPGAVFFPDAKLNFVENLLRKSGPEGALVFRGEDKVERRLSWDELHALVSRLQQALKAAGVGIGDRVAGMMPNMPGTIAAMLAATSLGAIRSSCSPDFGTRGVLDRFGQIEPKVFVACDGYWYNGERIEIAGKLAEIVPGLPTLEAAVIVPYMGEAETVAASLPKVVALDDFLAPFKALPVTFERLEMTHPLYILFPPARPAFPNASSIARAVCCCSI